MRLGTDPEFFLSRRGAPNAPTVMVPICGMLNADKWSPKQFEDMPKGFVVSEDNVAVEFGIPPAASAEEFKLSIKRVMRRFLKDHKNLRFSSLSAYSWPDEALVHPQAQTFGCDPDFNAWTGAQNPKPQADDKNLRSAGGHVHVETTLDPYLVGRAMDVRLGVPSVLMDTDGAHRRGLYGKHGAMRVKPYGLEYRALSNWWCFSDSTIQWVWNATAAALEDVKSGKDYQPLYDAIVQAIDMSDRDVASSLCKELNLELA
jgi:hypothetical protein